MSAEPEIVVVSDLHIGRGQNPETRRYHNLEAFFFDDDFADFIHHLCQDAQARSVRLRLVLNGDVFDFLRILRDTGDRKPASLRERRFGSALTPQSAAAMVKSQLEGHRTFTAALAWMLSRGHEVIFLPGNHDLEVHWRPVQEEIAAAVEAELDQLDEKIDSPGLHEETTADVMARLIFKPWFHYEEGRIWIEHGCQYDPENAFRYPLRGALADDAKHVHDEDTDLPLGNFFQRYLYNAFGSITFIVPTSRANARYFKWLLFNQPRLLVRVATSHLPFAIQLLRRMARIEFPRERKLQKAHEVELERLSQESGLGRRLRSIDALKSDKAHAATAVEAIAREGFRLIGMGLAVMLTMGLLWFSVLHAIDGIELGFGFKALLSLVSSALLTTVAIVGLGFYLMRVSQSPEPVKPLRAAAQNIAELLDVPIVTFGHTHDEGVWPLERQTGDGKAWYFNTGTWIAVFTHDVFLPRDRVQFTYLSVQGADAVLKAWSPGRGHPVPVVLIDDPAPMIDFD